MQRGIVNQYMSEKAGMQEVNKQKIAQTIQRLTSGTPKSLHQKQMQQKRQLQVAQMLTKCMKFTQQQRQEIKKQWWKNINEIKMKRVLDHYWGHFDFDMFYVACQLLEKPELKDKPCAVGGKNSVLCTANYQARKYGLRAAMPSFIALQLCPEVILFEPNFNKYRHYSNIFRTILSEYDPNLQSNGLDQAYIDLTQHFRQKNKQQIQKQLYKIRNRIFQATGLTVSCGVGANKLLAKMASQQRKPNDQFVIQNNSRQIQAYMKNKKIRKIPGIGPVNQFYLKGLGIQTAYDLLTNIDVLTICFSRTSVQFFISAALGIGSISHEFKQRKSVGKSQTFKNTNQKVFLNQRLQDLCQQVSIQLQQLGFVSINVVYSYQTGTFQKKDKTFNLNKYSDKKQDLYNTVYDFHKNLNQKVRLLGIKCNSLMKVDEYKKQQLFTYLNNPKKLKQAMNEQKSEITQIKQLMKNDIIEKGKFLCPVCSEYIDCKGNITLFNRHVDKCLTGQANVQSTSVEQNKSQKSFKTNKSKNNKNPNILTFFKQK